MARVRSVARGTQSVRPHSSEVDCFVQSINAEDGTPLVHISTFGSDLRASAPKSSQSMQFDSEQAARLIRYFIATFGPDVLTEEGLPL